MKPFLAFASLLFALGVAAAEKPLPSPATVRGFMVPDEAEADVFPAARAWGANVVRYQIDPVNFAREHERKTMEAWPDLLAQTVAAVRTASAAGLKVVVDLHHMPLDDLDPTLVAAWQSPDLEQNFVRVWSDLATALRPLRKAVWAFDLYNEPVERNTTSEDGWAPKAWRPLAERLVAAIRAIDPEVWLVYEVAPWDGAEGFADLVPLADGRIIYSVHFYEPALFTHQGMLGVGGLPFARAKKTTGHAYPGVINDEKWDRRALARVLAPVVAFQEKFNVPIYVGEFSAVRWAPAGSGARWLRDAIGIFEEHHWSWTYHAFREWNGWSLEHDGAFWMNGMPPPARASAETDRAKVVRAALARNAVEKPKR